MKYVLCMNDYPAAVLTAKTEEQAQAQMNAFIEDFRKKKNSGYRLVGRENNVLIPDSGFSLHFHLRFVPVWRKSK